MNPVMNSAMDEEAIQSDWVGRVIDGRFTLLQWLGGSGRSSVFLTELPGPQARKAAIKIIQDDGGDTEAEAHMAGWAATRPLSHPHLMRLILTGRCESEGTSILYAVSEYADEVLSEILPERALTPSEAKEMLAPVIDALFYLHGKDLVHGHLKPSNILVVDDRLKISGDSLQRSGDTVKQTLGQSIYDAPETASETVSPAADLWGLGVTLVEALTQHPPVWDKYAAEDPAVPESIPQPFAGIARGCLRADPMGRCTLDNVKSWLDADQPHNEPAGISEKSAPEKSRMPMLVAAAIVVVAIVGIFMLRPHKERASSPAAQVSSAAQQEASSAAQTSAQQPAPDGSAATEPQPQDQPQDQTAPAPAVAQPVAQQAHEQASTHAAAQKAPPPAVPQASVTESQVSSAASPSGPPANSAVAEQVMPDIQPKALASIHGKFSVRIRANVDAAGNVSDATFDSEGPSQYFAKAAMQAAQKWKFKTAQAGGQAAPG
ncbi:MAG: protein kinase, partial [Terracidiphilus sp.]